VQPRQLEQADHITARNAPEPQVLIILVTVNRMVPSLEGSAYDLSKQGGEMTVYKP
jgi:hypothetical protein